MFQSGKSTAQPFAHPKPHSRAQRQTDSNVREDVVRLIYLYMYLSEHEFLSTFHCWRPTLPTERLLLTYVYSAECLWKKCVYAPKLSVFAGNKGSGNRLYVNFVRKTLIPHENNTPAFRGNQKSILSSRPFCSHDWRYSRHFIHTGTWCSARTWACLLRFFHSEYMCWKDRRKFARSFLFTLLAIIFIPPSKCRQS